MELTAVFETWHLGDGNYPPLQKDMLVNLSFEIEPDEVSRSEDPALQRFDHLGWAQYQFTGLVLRVYNEEEPTDRIVVVEANGFRFYIQSSLLCSFGPGDHIQGRGTLLLDHYAWVEFLACYPDPPDLFYLLRVTHIKRFQIPTHLIARTSNSFAYPNRLSGEECAQTSSTEVDVVVRENFVTYLIGFSSVDLSALEIPRTFLG